MSTPVQHHFRHAFDEHGQVEVRHRVRKVVWACRIDNRRDAQKCDSLRPERVVKNRIINPVVLLCVQTTACTAPARPPKDAARKAGTVHNFRRRLPANAFGSVSRCNVWDMQHGVFKAMAIKLFAAGALHQRTRFLRRHPFAPFPH
jgi:hypothetical protein